MKSISTKISPTLFAQIRARAVGNGVTISTYVAALLAEHTDESPLIGVVPRPSGLAGAGPATRKRVAASGGRGKRDCRRVSRAGVDGRGSKERDRG